MALGLEKDTGIVGVTKESSRRTSSDIREDTVGILAISLQGTSISAKSPWYGKC